MIVFLESLLFLLLGCYSVLFDDDYPGRLP